MIYAYFQCSSFISFVFLNQFFRFPFSLAGISEGAHGIEVPRPGSSSEISKEKKENTAWRRRQEIRDPIEGEEKPIEGGGPRRQGREGELGWEEREIKRLLMSVLRAGSKIFIQESRSLGDEGDSWDASLHDRVFP